MDRRVFFRFGAVEPELDCMQTETDSTDGERVVLAHGESTLT
jgi:hypothetical protein